jgi:UTP--glucose-1-phosphate uridylyltransferase
MGTRFLPVTKAVPKELLPIIDTPALQLVIDEAVRAGMDHVVIVGSAAKPGLDAYLRVDDDVVRRVRESGRADLAERLGRLGRDVRVTVVHQDAPRGLGHAVGCAREAVGDAAFAVMLPDELMGDAGLLTSLVERTAATGVGAVGLMRVPKSEVGAYGVITPEPGAEHGGPFRIMDVVEKPDPADAPSNLIIIGRYVLTPDVFEAIDSIAPSANGELQLTDALRLQASRDPLHGMLNTGSRHDTGTPMGWLTAVIDIALERPDTGNALAAWLRGRLD